MATERFLIICECEHSVLGELNHNKYACHLCGTDSATPHSSLRATFSQDPGEGEWVGS